MRTSAQVDWQAAQVAVADAGRRVGALVRSIRRPDAHALGEWNVTQLAAHVSHVVDGITAVVLGAGGVLADISELSSLTGNLVRGESDHDPGVLADRIEAGTDRLLSVLADAADDGQRMWFVRGMDLPLSSITCHALNELVVHGRDLALAEGVPWTISRPEAALVVCGFFLPAMAGLGPSLVNRGVVGDQQATFDVRVRGGCRWTIHFDGGNLDVHPGEPSGRVDCHLSVDPAAFLLVGWRRISQWPAIARGQLFGWGRRPWFGPKLASMILTP